MSNLHAILARGLVVPGLLLLSAHARGQLDQRWTVRVHGQAVRVNADGSFQIPNVAAADQFGRGGPGTAPDFLSDDALRLVGAARIDGTTRYVYSSPFRIQGGHTKVIEDLVFSDEPPPFPESIAFDARMPGVLAVGDTMPALVRGVLIDGSEISLSTQESGTSYRTSNPMIARIAPDGEIEGVSVGTVFLTAVNNSTTAVRRLDIVSKVATTTIQGFVQFLDQTPAPSATITTLYGGTAQSAANGYFHIDHLQVPGGSASINVIGRITIDGAVLSGSSGAIPIVVGGVTDAGVIRLAPQSGPLFPALGLDAGLGARDMVVVDFDHNGLPDIAVVDAAGGSLSLLLNRGSRGFDPRVVIPVGPCPSLVRNGDLDHDGDEDLLIADECSPCLFVLRGDGQGHFSPGPCISAPSCILDFALSDVDGDNDLDIVVLECTNEGSSLILLRQDPSGSFAPATTIFGAEYVEGFALGRFDAGTTVDIVVTANAFGTGYSDALLLPGNGAGAFGPPQPLLSMLSFFFLSPPIATDLESDGDLDLIIRDYDQIHALKNDGLGHFTDTTLRTVDLAPTSLIVTADLNGDGKKDLLLPNGSYYRIDVFLGQASGGFVQVGFLPVAAYCTVDMSLDDMDGDGQNDLTLLQCSDSISIYPGNGDGSFDTGANCLPLGIVTSVALGDLDGDGDADLVANSLDAQFKHSELVSALGSGHGSFAAPVVIAQDAGTDGVALARMDADDDLDLLSFGYKGRPPSLGVHVRLGNGHGGFGPIATYAVDRCADVGDVGDVNGDGFSDIVYSNPCSERIEVLLGTGLGGFQAPADGPKAGSINWLRLGHMNNDAWLDIVTTSDNSKGGGISVYLGNGDGTFDAAQSTDTAEDYAEPALGDIDADGHTDIVAYRAFSDDVVVLFGSATGALSAPAPIASVGNCAYRVALSDLDLDGDLDIVFEDICLTRLAVSRGNGDGTFAPVESYAIGACKQFGLGLHMADLDNDGDVDLVAQLCDGCLTTLLNLTIPNR